MGSMLLTVLAVAGICCASRVLLAKTAHRSTLLDAAFIKRAAWCFALALFAQMAVLRSFAAILQGGVAVLVAVAAAGLFWLCVLVHTAVQKKSHAVQIAGMLSLLLAGALLCEIFVFNGKFFCYAANAGTPPQAVYTDATTNTDAHITELSYQNIGGAVNNLYLDVGTAPQQKKLESLTTAVTFDEQELRNQVVTVRIFVTDAANAMELALTERIVLHGLPATQYIALNLAAPVQTVRVQLEAPEGYSPVLCATGLNMRVPMQVSWIRLLILFAVFSAVWLLRPNSFLHDIRLDITRKKQRVAIVLTVLACTALLLSAAALNTGYYGNPQRQDGMYQELARHLAQGDVTLGAAPEFLTEMENPYDATLRNAIAAAVREDTQKPGYRWDTAYYNGSYYVYFGIVPELLFYLPFYLVTGKDLPNLCAMLLLFLPLVCGVFALLYHIVKKRFTRLSLTAYLGVCSMACLCSCTVFLAKRPDFYSLPIMAALVFSVWGLYCWLTALERPALHAGYLFAGSLCMALVAGCRPQIVLFSFLALPIFWRSVFQDRTLLSRKGIGTTVCFALPYVLVAAGLMYYNYIRFASPFEFGAQYNLTVNDLTQRGFVWERIGGGLFTYLFQPPNVSGVFPFFGRAAGDTTYMGMTFNVALFGGVITCNPFLWLLPLLWKDKAGLREKRLYVSTVLAAGIALAIAAADIQMGGVLQRYISDFGFALFVVAAVVALGLAERAALCENAAMRKALRSFLFLAVSMSLLYSLATVFQDDGASLLNFNPSRFYRVMYGTCFWL